MNWSEKFLICPEKKKEEILAFSFCYSFGGKFVRKFIFDCSIANEEFWILFCIILDTPSDNKIAKWCDNMRTSNKIEWQANLILENS